LEHGIEYNPKAKEGKGEKVAIIGAGPAGLTCAYYLAIEGYKPVVFEALEAPGGLLRWGIPEYRLPKEILQKEIRELEKLGVEIRTKSKVEDIDKLFSEGYRAIFVAAGAHRGIKLGIPGEDLQGVYDALDFLKRVNSGEDVKVGKRVAVIGGGNAAIDSARVALRKGAEVHLFYRRERKDMPAIEEEIAAAEEEGVKFHFLTTPVEIIGKGGKVRAIKLVRMRLGEFDRSARRKAEPIEGSEFTVEVDAVIEAVGQAPDLAFLERAGVKLTKGGLISVDPRTLATSRKGVFAGGDAVTGPATVTEAMAAGKRAAFSIKAFLEGKGTIPEMKRAAEGIEIPSVPPPEEEIAEKPRAEPSRIPLERRVRTFEEVVKNYDRERAIEEAGRCLRCDLQTG
jgi:NADH-quinone oxidoreductase subunit F